MNTILAAVDFSKFSRPVIFDAVRFSQQFEAHLYILHVVTFPRDPLYGAAVSKSGGIGTAQETAVLKQIEQLVPPTSVQWRGVIRYGDPIEKIGEFCRDSEADLVMVASHGFSGWKRMLLGSVVEHLARSLSRPLWVMRRTKSFRPETNDRPTRVLVGCDVNAPSYEVIAQAVQLATAFGAELHMAHAAEAPLNEAVLDPTSGPYGEVQQVLQDRLHQCLRGWIPADIAPPGTIKTVVLPGLPGEELLDYARSNRIDLIIVGVRPHRQVEKWLIGSTTESLLRHAPCPVITVPTAAA